MRRPLAVISLALVVSLALGSTAQAFDGQRQGFILGAGIGTGLCSYTQEISGWGLSETSDRETELGIMSDFKIGYAPNDLVQVYWVSKVSWFGMENALGDDVTIATGVAGLGMTYFFQPAAPSAFISGGIGYSSWTAPFESDVDAWYGLGLSVGAGYEFSPHWCIEGSMCWGNPSTDDEYGLDYETNALSLRVAVNVIGY